MTDWSKDLATALAAGDVPHMQDVLARVPREVLVQAVPHLNALAKKSVQDGRFQEALGYYGLLLDVVPGNVDWLAERARSLLKLERFADVSLDAARIVELAPMRSLGYRLQAEAHEGLHESPLALAAYRRALHCEPGDETIKRKIAGIEESIRTEALLRQTLDPDSVEEELRIELPPPPEVTFDPALFDDASLPDATANPMVEALRQHLWRYSGHQSSKNTLARFEDPVWLAAWDRALSATAGSSVLFGGSELGVFALRALAHGADRAVAVEPFPLDARIANGIVHKHFLRGWHALHGAVVQGWTEDERRSSFEDFAQGIDIVAPDGGRLAEQPCDVFVFPQIDHSLLGTGIVRAIRRYRSAGLAAGARILPAKARIFAMGIQWNYSAAHFRLQPLDRLRWSAYPQAMDLPPDAWTAMTESANVGDIDFENFSENVFDLEFSVVAEGKIDAIMFWFELDLGAAKLDNAPGGKLKCIAPAVQYTDAVAVQPGMPLRAHAHVMESRLHFSTEPAASRLRSHALPGWYVPRLLDRERNDAYAAALTDAMAAEKPRLVLDIGAGCGLLSMMAAQAGADRVVACEAHPEMASLGKEVVALNGLEDKVVSVGKDCRRMKVPDDLAERADFVLFEQFDASLIGEGVLHYLAHAREHLLAPSARYLPMAAKIRGMAIEYRLDRLWDIDINLLNPYRFSTTFVGVDAKESGFRALTEPFDVFSFDFSAADPAAQDTEIQVPAIADGVAGAMLFWFDMQLDENRWISNAPDSAKPAHWKQGLQLLPEVQVSTGMVLPVVAKHNGSVLKFHWKQDALPMEAFSKIPLFDPRWLAATHELEHQTRGLLQHCMQNPDEYARVAELAKRFAVDPAAYDLDPAIAQRFAAAFLGM